MGCFEALKKYFIICDLRDKPWWYYAKWNEPIKKKANIAWFHFCEVRKLIKSMETENTIVVAKDYEEGELLLSMCKASVMQDEKVLQICCRAMCT